MSRRESQEGSQDDTLVVLAEGSMRAPLVRGGELARSLGTGASSERAHDGAASFCFLFPLQAVRSAMLLFFRARHLPLFSAYVPSMWDRLGSLVWSLPSDDVY